jgi:hypothetical protein
MVEVSHTIGLVLERRLLTGRWGGYQWSPHAVFVEAPDVAPWTPLGAGGTLARYYAGEAIVHLYSTETANYRDNLASDAPKLWVVLRADGPEPPVEVVVVTADPAEGEANTEAGNNTVETIDMPAEIAAWIAEFIAAHHVERPVVKRRRDRAEPQLLWRDGRREPGDKTS